MDHRVLRPGNDAARLGRPGETTEGEVMPFVILAVLLVMAVVGVLLLAYYLTRRW